MDYQLLCNLLYVIYVYYYINHTFKYLLVMEKVLILTDVNDKVINVYSITSDIENLIRNFIDVELFGLLRDIEYYQDGSFHIFDKEENNIEIHIFGDNGMLVFKLKEFIVTL